MLPSVSHTYPPVKHNLHLAFLGAPFILPAMSLGDQIRRARQKKELSQQAIAKAFGISRAAVAQWENGTTRPDQGKLVELARMLGLGLDDLLADGNAWSGESRPPVAAPDRELLDAWENLLPREREALLADIKQKAAHNLEAADHFKSNPVLETEGRTIRVSDRRKGTVWFGHADRRKEIKSGEG